MLMGALDIAGAHLKLGAPRFRRLAHALFRIGVALQSVTGRHAVFLLDAYRRSWERLQWCRVCFSGAGWASGGTLTVVRFL